MKCGEVNLNTCITGPAQADFLKDDFANEARSHESHWNTFFDEKWSVFRSDKLRIWKVAAYIVSTPNSNYSFRF